MHVMVPRAMQSAPARNSAGKNVLFHFHCQLYAAHHGSHYSTMTTTRPLSTTNNLQPLVAVTVTVTMTVTIVHPVMKVRVVLM